MSAARPSTTTSYRQCGPVVAFDVLYRLLKRRYPRVTYVRNITDIDDRIMVRAADNKETIAALTTRTGDAYKSDMRRLGAFAPDFEPRATEYVGPMIAMIEQLIARGSLCRRRPCAFSVPSMSDYGACRGHTRDELVAGARSTWRPIEGPGRLRAVEALDAQSTGLGQPWGAAGRAGTSSARR